THLQERIDKVPDDRMVVVHCASGYRSSIAASLLEQNKVKDSADLVGGIAAWEAAQLNSTLKKRGQSARNIEE
ncbi:rhodanese-like domain-containing protein, partial [Acidobacteria bacterium AH-259-L09]|nr:rhodanese-like domain-containing protein [Acidobacteria bacterium AH-259-L09]